MKLVFIFPCNSEDFVSMPSFTSHFVFHLWSVPLSKMVAKFKHRFCISLIFSVSSFYVTKPLLDCCFDFGLGDFFALFWVIVSWSPNCIEILSTSYCHFSWIINTSSSFFCRFCLFLLAALVAICLGMFFYKKKKVLMARDWRYKSAFHCSSKELVSFRTLRFCY